MICERCHKRAATIKYTEVVKGKAILRNICETCLSELRGDASGGFELTGAPSAKGPAAAPREVVMQSVPRACGTCGLPFKELTTLGRAGCASCFSTFAEPIGAMLTAIQAAPHHTGKALSAPRTQEHVRTELRVKRSLLRSAVKTEDYESAALLRDAIRRLEAELAAPTAGHN